MAFKAPRDVNVLGSTVLPLFANNIVGDADQEEGLMNLTDAD